MTATPAGTRLRCPRCGTEVIVVKAAEVIACCDAPMTPQEA